MTVRIGINGFGRIGRNVFRAAAAGADVEIVAVNDLGDVPTMAHLLAHDSILERFPGEITAEPGAIRIGDTTVAVLAERAPAALPWGDLGVDVVIESTGVFTDAARARAHVDGREEGHHRRPGHRRGRHDRPRYAEAAAGPYKGLLFYTEAPLVSTDIAGDPASCVFDAELTRVTGSQVKVVGWYDNEWGYSNRLIDLALPVGGTP